MIAAKARTSGQWDHTAALLCLTAEINRNPKARRKPFKPEEFHPMAEDAEDNDAKPISELGAMLDGR